MRTKTLATHATLLLAMLAMAGCSKPPEDPNIAACPEKTIRVLQSNQAFMESIKVGETSTKELRRLPKPVRKATLEREGDTLRVFFYQTGLPRCPWVLWGESLTPVVVQDGVIVAFGSGTLREMTAHGWVLKEAKWPWQRYDFGYLPIQ